MANGAGSVRVGWSPILPKVTLVSKAANVEMDYGPTSDARMSALGHKRTVAIVPMAYATTDRTARHQRKRLPVRPRCRIRRL